MAHSNAMFLFLLAGGPNPIAAAGLLITGVEYLLKRNTSRWLAFQTLQALIYQVVLYLVISALVVTLLSTPPVAQAGLEVVEFTAEQSIALSLSTLAMFYGIIGLVRCFRGRHFRYPLLGHLLERSMRPLDE